MTGTPERLGGKPRENVDDAYATFMDMDHAQWWGLLNSLLRGGRLTPIEEEAFNRAVIDRPASQS